MVDVTLISKFDQSVAKQIINSNHDAIENGIEAYVNIIDQIKDSGFTASGDFQTKYRAFYRMRRSKELYKRYFDLMLSQKKATLSFEDLLIEIYRFSGCVEASFTSKLIASVDPSYAIWDQIVTYNLGLKLERERIERMKDHVARIQKTAELYDEINDWYKAFLASPNGQAWIAEFDSAFPDYKDRISPVKKIDFLLWQWRP